VQALLSVPEWQWLLLAPRAQHWQLPAQALQPVQSVALHAPEPVLLEARPPRSVLVA
jgi:hypothetical protein